MQLKFIKTETCPICGTRIVIEESVDKEPFRLELQTHVNGGRWEHRTFICGQRIDYIPNYSEEVISEYHVCRNNTEYLEQIKKEKEAKEKVMEFVNTLDVNDKCKERLLKDIKYA